MTKTNQKHSGTVVELFAGVGGFRLGLERSGWETVFSNQWEPSTKTQQASSCYVANFGVDGHSNDDIAKVVARLVEGEKAAIPETGKYSIYQAGGRWLIQQGEKRGFGDHIVDSREEAVAASTQQLAMEKANKDYFDKVKAKEDAERAAQEAKDKPLNDYLCLLYTSPSPRDCS